MSRQMAREDYLMRLAERWAKGENQHKLFLFGESILCADKENEFYLEEVDCNSRVNTAIAEEVAHFISILLKENKVYTDEISWVAIKIVYDGWLAYFNDMIETFCFPESADSQRRYKNLDTIIANELADASANLCNI